MSEQLLRNALERLSFAALARDATAGDPIRLIEVRAELHAANMQALEALLHNSGAVAECDCSAKDMPFGRCCKAASEQKMREALPPLPPVGLGAFDNHPYMYTQDQMMDFAIAAVKAALSQREAQEPVAYTDGFGMLWMPGELVASNVVIPLYTAPPSREVPDEAHRVIKLLVEQVREMDDKGPRGEGWQSAELCQLIKDSEALLASKGGV